MGIRIHKVIGYGLTDIQTEGKYNEIITDPRINPKGYYGNDPVHAEERFSDEGFDEYIEKHLEDDNDPYSDLRMLYNLRRQQKAEGTTEYKDRLFYRLIYDNEGGLPNVMVFQPPIFGRDWSRYDDIIDYYDPANSDPDGGMTTDFVLLDRPIYPFESYWNIKENPPKRLMGDAWHWYSSRNLSEAMVELACEELGFESKEEMERYITPMIPKELVALLKYCKVFTKDEYIAQLRPMIYWYWS